MLRFITLCQSSSVCSQMGAALPAMPALFTRISSEPVVAMTRATAAATCAGLVTSRTSANAPAPILSATAVAEITSTSAMATRAPAAASRWAITSPMPVPAPVTRAVCPVSSIHRTHLRRKDKKASKVGSPAPVHEQDSNLCRLDANEDSLAEHPKQDEPIHEQGERSQKGVLKPRAQTIEKSIG